MRFFLSRCQYQNKKALFTDPIFIDGFGINNFNTKAKLHQMSKPQKPIGTIITAEKTVLVGLQKQKLPF